MDGVFLCFYSNCTIEDTNGESASDIADLLASCMAILQNQQVVSFYDVSIHEEVHSKVLNYDSTNSFELSECTEY